MSETQNAATRDDLIHVSLTKEEAELIRILLQSQSRDMRKLSDLGAWYLTGPQDRLDQLADKFVEPIPNDF